MGLETNDTFSLPPRLKDEVQGRLDIIFLRPVLMPSLSSHFCLDLKICWWGSETENVVRFPADQDEHKLLYKIRCNLNGLQKYFQDAKEFKVDVFVGSDQLDEAGIERSPSKSLPGRKKKEWKEGDYVGKFTVPELKLNSRGEYVNECTIFNFHGENCGSLVVFMLFSNTKIEAQHKVVPKNPLVSENARNRPVTPGKETDNYFKNKTSRQLQLSTPEVNSKSKFNRDTLSPRFLAFPKSKKSPNKEKIDASKNKKSPMKNVAPKCLSGSKTPTEDVGIVTPQLSTSKQFKVDNSFHISEMSVLSSNDLSELRSASFNQNYILTRLFSFVDSGAIRASDIPALVQIYQGRSPSIEFSSLTVSESSLMKSCSESEIILEQSVFHPDKSLERSLSTDGLAKPKKSVNFSGHSRVYSSGHLDSKSPVKKLNAFSGNKEKPKNTPQKQRYLNSSELTKGEKPLGDYKPLRKTKSFDTPKLPMDDREKTHLNPKLKQTDSLPLEALEHESEISMHRLKLSKSNKEMDFSLLMLRLDSVQFDRRVEEAANRKGRRSAEPAVANVRQRSKLCYFVEVSCKSDDLRSPPQSIVFVSRHVQCQDVAFNGTHIFRLAKTVSLYPTETLDFKVMRRTLGNRLTETVGVVMVNLREIRSGHETDEISVTLPVWPPDEGSRVTFSRSGELPIGHLRATLTFALAADPDMRLPDQGSPGIPRCENSTYRPLRHSPEPAIPVPPKPDGVVDQVAIQCTRAPSEKRWGESNHESPPHESGRSAPLGDENAALKRDSADHDSLAQDVYLEIIEGNSMPRLIARNTGKTTLPSPYIKVDLPSAPLMTPVCESSSQPKWNFATSFRIRPDDLNQTDSYLIMKVFHRVGSDCHEADPMLGFAAIDTRFLWNSFVSMCGWIPILNLDGEICGEIKVSLTPKRLRSWFSLPQKSCLSFVGNPSDVYAQSRVHHEQGDSPLKDRGSPSNPSSTNADKTLGNRVTDSLNTTFIDLEATRGLNYLMNYGDRDIILDQPLCDEARPINSPLKQFAALEPENTLEDEIKHLSLRSLDETELSDSSRSNSANVIHSRSTFKADSSSNKENIDISADSSRHVEGFLWMNHSLSFDSPCVSYIDTITQGNKRGSANSRAPKVSSAPPQMKKVKSRLAANFDVTK